MRRSPRRRPVATAAPRIRVAPGALERLISARQGWSVVPRGRAAARLERRDEVAAPARSGSDSAAAGQSDDARRPGRRITDGGGVGLGRAIDGLGGAIDGLGGLVDGLFFIFYFFINQGG